MSDFHALPNLGAKTGSRLQAAGIADTATLRLLGAAEAYRRLKAAFPRETSLNALWALAGAIDGRDWRSYTPAEKAALKALVAAD